MFDTALKPYYNKLINIIKELSTWTYKRYSKKK